LGEEGVEARDDAVKEEMEENADEDMVLGRSVTWDVVGML
jgi:hypothetical protein